MSNLKIATRTVHAGFGVDAQTGAVTPPVYQTSTYAQKGPGKHQGYEYSRSHNPTRDALEDKLASLENGKHGISFASGCAAASAIMMCLKSGDHVIAMEDGYGGTHRLFSNIFKNLGIQFDFLDLRNPQILRDGLRPNTKLVWIESPTNPMMSLVDIADLAQICQDKNITLVVDNTFATPIIQNPLDLGADLVVHSTSKYINGHSDVVGGAVITKTDDWNDRIRYTMNSAGGMPGPWDAYLTLRGCKTLKIRVDKQTENAQVIADFLESHPKVNRVWYPGLKSHPQYGLAQKQMRAPGAMVSFEIKGGLDAAHQMMSSTKLFTCAESLGGVESLVNHPGIMTHAAVPEDLRKKLGIHDGLIRLSVGIEDAEDLIDDLKSSLT